MPTNFYNEVIHPRMEDNKKMIASVPSRIIDREYPARGSGWLEYRFMSLMDRTKIFAEEYCDRYRWNFGRVISFDFDPASKEFARLWQMRHSADIHGVSYGLYLNVCFSFYRIPKYAERLAVPSDTFAKREEKRTWRTRFLQKLDEQRYAEYARLTRMSQFWINNYEGLPAQDACRKRLIALAKHGRRYKDAAERFAISARVVPLADILSVVPDANERADIVASLRAEVSSSRVILQSAPKSVGSRLQTCFGLPRSLNGAEPHCSKCPHRQACALAADVLSRMPRAA